MAVSIRGIRVPPSEVKSSGEVSQFLNLAASLEEKCQAERDTLLNRTMVLASLSVAFVALVMFIWILDLPLSSTWRMGLTIVLFVFGLLWFPALVTRVKRTKRDLARDQRALFSVVDLLQALEQHLDDMPHLSVIDKVSFRIQLARYDISPEPARSHPIDWDDVLEIGKRAFVVLMGLLIACGVLWLVVFGISALYNAVKDSNARYAAKKEEMRISVILGATVVGNRSDNVLTSIAAVACAIDLIAKSNFADMGATGKENPLQDGSGHPTEK
jgi:ABC-type multidrug transport system fused ATPase/permease subunit